MKYQWRSATVALAFAWVLGLVAPPAQAGCDLALKGVRQDSQRTYSIFSPSISVIELTVSMNANNCPRLDFIFGSANSNTLVGPDGRIPYQLKSLSGRNIPVNGISPVPGNELLTSRSNTSLVLRAVLAQGSFSGPGRYTDQINLKVSDGRRTLAESDLPLAIEVMAEADIALTGQASNGYSRSGGGGMNFGALEPGKEKSAYLFVRSNSSYALNISSENKGYLAHREEVGAHARIPYSAWLDNERLVLTEPMRVRTNGMTPVYRSRPHRLSARIEPFRNKLAGNYQDVILVEVVFLE